MSIESNGFSKDAECNNSFEMLALLEYEAACISATIGRRLLRRSIVGRSICEKKQSFFILILLFTSAFKA
jgi:hypothetical protein